MKMRPVLFSVAVGLLSIVSVAPDSASAQQPAQFRTGPPSRETPCPVPGSTSINAQNPPALYGPDFATITGPIAQLNDPAENKTFRYTFKWVVPEKLCCEITNAVLTVKLKKNTGDFINDTMAVGHNGATVPGHGGPIWGPNDGPTKTVVWTMNATALGYMNADNRLSFSVQDDTMVESATLEMKGCCVNQHR